MIEDDLGQADVIAVSMPGITSAPYSRSWHESVLFGGVARAGRHSGAF
jgi:hypothetical protein